MEEKILIALLALIGVCIVFLVGLGIYEVWVEYDWVTASALTAVIIIATAAIGIFALVKGGDE